METPKYNVLKSGTLGWGPADHTQVRRGGDTDPEFPGDIAGFPCPMVDASLSLCGNIEPSLFAGGGGWGEGEREGGGREKREGEKRRREGQKERERERERERQTNALPSTKAALFVISIMHFSSIPI
jgi:hypothetical protein